MNEYNFTSTQKLIDILEASVGYLEKRNKSDLGDLFTEEGKIVNAGANNYTIIAKDYQELTGENYQGQAWCAMYVSVMFARVFGKIKGKALLKNKFYSYCPNIINQFKNAIYDDPKTGDIVVFYSSSLGRYSHTGIVVNVNDNGSFVTIEGNTSAGNDIVIRNGGCIAKKSYTSKPTKCKFCRPDWAANGITENGGLLPKIYNIKGTLTLLQNTPMYDEKGEEILTMEEGCACVVSKKRFIGQNRQYYVCYKHQYGWACPDHMTGWVQEIDDQGHWWYMLDKYQWYAGCITAINSKPFIFYDNGYCATNDSIEVMANSEGYLSITHSENL